MNTTTLRRSLLVFSLGSAVLAPSLFAATDTPPPPPPAHHGHEHAEGGFDPEKRLARMTENLGLTAEQQAKIRPLLVAQAEAMKAIDSQALTGDQRREKMMQLRKTNREQIGAILTPEQRTKIADKRHEMKEHRGQHQDAPPPPPPAK